jgi:ATP-dependent 26S proteasome regulatory subunit
MARADLLKKLFHSYRSRDERAFAEAAEEIIEEERRKHHPVVANELARILRNGAGNLSEKQVFEAFDPPPKDPDRKTTLLEIRQPDRYLDDLVLSAPVRKGVERVVAEFREWEVLEANGLSPTNRLLLCGPPGCGKTATAEAIATELGLPLLYVRFDSVVSSLLGETAANLRKVFDYASRGQWVMFFDEFDAIGRSRDDATEHGEIKRVVNSYLQIMDGFRGRSLVIAATNFEAVLDRALWRRFDEVLRLERPSIAQLKILIRKRLKPLVHQASDVDDIAEKLKGATFADAEHVCLDLRKHCAIAGHKKFAQKDLDEVLERFAYRQSILTKAQPDGTPEVDRE